MKNILIILVFFVTLYSFSCKAINEVESIEKKEQGIDSTIFLAGAAVANITPPTTPNVHDSLFAKTLVLDNGIEKLVFVIVDNQGLPSYVCQAAKNAVHLATGIPVSNVLISSTHTHTSIIAGQEIEYYTKPPADLIDAHRQLIIDRISLSVITALGNLQPAKIGWGGVNKSEHVFNRRWYMKNPVYSPLGILDSVKMNPSFQHPDLVEHAGPVDPEVSFIAVKSTSGIPIAILANYSLHYVGGIEANFISADYYGEFGRSLKQLLGVESLDTPFVGIMSNGTSGDVNNHNYGAPYIVSPNYQKMAAVAEDIAEDVVAEYNVIQFHDWVSLGAKTKNMIFSKRTPSAQELSNKSLIEANTGTPLFNSQEKTYATRLNSFMSLYPDNIPATVQAFMIGDLVIGTAPFEMFAEMGLALKASSPFDKTFIIGIGNGHWGYLPTPSQHLKGGYETWITVNRVQKDASDLIVAELLSMFNSF